MLVDHFFTALYAETAKLRNLCCHTLMACTLSLPDALWAKSDLLTVAIDSDIRSTEPGVNRDSNTDTVLLHVVETLVAYDEDLTVKPLLAQSVEVADDGKTYRFHLRKDVRFHNGSPLLAEHVIWNWQRFLDDKTLWRCKSWYDGSNELSVRILAVEAPEPHTVDIKLERPSASFLHRIANIQCLTGIVHPNSVDGNGAWISPIGTGPYKISEWKRGEYVELEKNGFYTSGKGEKSGLVGKKEALIDRIKFLVVPDAAVAKSAVQSNGVDFLINAPIATTKELSERPSINLHTQPVLEWVTLLVQTQDSVLRNPVIRKALYHAIDRQALAGYATQSQAPENPSAVPNLNPNYTRAHLRAVPFDLDKAQRLLAQEGYHGESITIQTNKKQLHLFENAVIVHAMLKSAGFNVELEVLDWATQLSNYFNGDFQLSLFDFSARADPFLNYMSIVGDKSKNPAKQWSDERALQLLVRTENVNSEAERKALFEKMHWEMIEQIPIIGLYNSVKVTVVNAEIAGFKTWILNKPRFWGITK